MSIRVNTENVAVNAVDGILAFNSNALEVLSISKAGSVIGVWVQEPKYSNSQGVVDFSGVILNPGYTGRSGLVLTIVFRVKASGSINFSSGSVLANDGYGTNVLRAMTGSTFSAVVPTKTPQASSSPNPESPAPIKESFILERVDRSDPTNPRPEFLWSISGNTSAISHYEIKVDNQEGVRLDYAQGGKKYALSPQYPGRHVLVVKAFDNTQTIAVASASFDVVSIDPPIIQSGPGTFKDGQYIRFAGTAKPGYKVELYGVNKEKNPALGAKIIIIESNSDTLHISESELQKNSFRIAQAQADESGNWGTEIASPPTGEYYVYARSIDDRGAISSPSNATLVNIYKPGLSRYLNFLDKAWQVALDFLVNKWLWIIIALLGVAAVIAFVEKVVPILVLEWQRLRYISGEYKLDKELGAKTRKTLFELEILNSDIKKELALLNKIEDHRGLHRDEKYLKEKLEKYSKLLKSLH